MEVSSLSRKRQETNTIQCWLSTLERVVGGTPSVLFVSVIVDEPHHVVVVGAGFACINEKLLLSTLSYAMA